MLQTQQINKIFEQREKQILEEASRLAKETARRELALLEFEMFYGVMIPEKSKQKAERSLKKLRNKRWKEALKKAKGNEEKAIFLYDAA
jgi:N-acetylmuramic acid 6-phosphate (MurNAc-6-P) etherase